MEKRQDELDEFRTWLGEDGIIRTVTRSGMTFTLEDAKENIAEIERVRLDKKRPILVHVHRMKAMNKSVRVYLSTESSKILTAVGLLIEGKVSAVLANFFIGSNIMNIPTKMFTQEEKAVAWLKKYIL